MDQRVARDSSSLPPIMSSTEPLKAEPFVFFFQEPQPYFPQFDAFFDQFITSDELPPQPHSCPPSLQPAPTDGAPELQLPRNLADPLDPNTEQHPVTLRSSYCTSLTPAIPASPTSTQPPIAPRTPACTALQNQISSPHISTPLSSLAISNSVPPHPLTASSPTITTITPTISKRTRATKRTRLPGTPVTPHIHTTQPILQQLMSLDIMANFGTHPSDIDTMCATIENCVATRAKARKLQLRTHLKDDSKITSSQREAKVSRLYHNQILEGYREAIREVVGAWYKDAASTHARS